MIGQTVESRPPAPVGTIAFLMVAVGIAVFTAVDTNPDRFGWVVGALMPAGIAAALFLTRRAPIRLHFTDTGIEVEASSEVIPYRQIEGLVAAGRPADPAKPATKHYPIAIVHEEGTLHLTANLDVPPEDVFHFLLATFPPGGGRQVNRLLREYQERQEETFGGERVFSYRARNELGHWSRRAMTAFFLAIAAVSVVWIGYGAGQNAGGFIGAGVAFFFLSLIFLGILTLANRSIGGVRGLKRWQDAGLVISPVGIALVQGDMKGEMRWDELRDLKFKSGGDGSLVDPISTRALVLHFEGAEVNVADVYDRPLNLIYQVIRRHWRRE